MASKFSELVKLNFLPTSANCGLFALRVWLGLSMLLIHGLGKIQKFSATVAHFHDTLHVPVFIAWIAAAVESVCGALLVIGFLTRFSALVLAVQMAVAFYFVHHMNLDPTSAQSGERAFLYLAGFVALFLGGGGILAVDGKSGK